MAEVMGVLPSFIGIGTINVQGTPLINFTRRVFPQPEQMCDLILKRVPIYPQRDGI